MAGSPTGKERRKTPRRNEDIKPMERLSAVEKEARALSKSLNRHVEGCESAAKKNEQDNALILKRQQEHGAVLTELQDVLPWLKQTFAEKKARDQAWHKVGDFFSNMARKNWDSLSGKLIFLAVGAVLVWRGASWADIVKMVIH